MWDGKRMWYGTKEEWKEWSEWFEVKTNPIDLLNSLLSGYYDIEFGDEDDKYVWLQSTGLTDKNEKEIYEGDIVKIDTGSKIYYDVVVWSADENKLEENMWCLRNYEGFWTSEMEVIGNIYENPELLEEIKRMGDDKQ